MPVHKETLEELMALLKRQTPSSGPWYQVVDAVVGSLLANEIERAIPSPPEKD